MDNTDCKLVKNIDVRLTHKRMLILSGIIGAVWFLLWYGYECLDFTNVNWIFNSYNDLTTHYIGWVHYRNSDWSFPLGFFSGLTGEDSNSIVYTDSIPLFAIFFKLFRGILPDDFQYFGLFSLISVVLQAVLGSELVYRLTGKMKESLIGSVLFVSATVLSRRLFDHTSLTFHAIILSALILFFATDDKRKNIFIKWILLLILSVSIHAYYVPMVMAIEVFYYIKESKVKDWLKVISKIVISLIVVVVSMGVLGYFGTASYSVDNDTLGSYGTSINALFYGQGYSLIDMLRGDVNNIWELEEGYAYLGLGVILLAVISLGYEVYVGVKQKKTGLGRTAVLVMCLFFIFFVLSMIPVIRWNWDRYFIIPLPAFVKKILGIFRSNGRFIWPAFYLVMLSACVIIIRKSRYALAILAVTVFIQIADLCPYYMLQANDMDKRVESEYHSDMVNMFVDDYDYVMLMDEPNSDDGIGFDETCKIGYYSTTMHIPLSDFYMARKDEIQISDKREAVSADIADNIIEDDWIYVFSDVPFQYITKDTELHFYTCDGLVCGTSKRMEGASELNMDEGINMISANGYIDVDVTQGIANMISYTSEVVPLEPNHILYENINLTSGEYRIDLTGEGVSCVEANIAGDNCSSKVLDHSDGVLSIEIYVTGEMTPVYIQYYNAGSDIVYVDELKISY